MRKWLLLTLLLLTVVSTINQCISIRFVFSDGSSKEYADPGTRAMKETTAYMMTEMMKTVLAYGTGRGAYLPWLPQAGKTGTSNYTDEEIENYIKNTGYVAPDEMFVGYTRKYSMAVWTGYSNRLTPIVGDGFYVAAKVYRSMMTYLSEDNNPGDWTMPEGLYRSGEFVFKTVLVLHGLLLLRNRPQRLKVRARHQKVQLHSQAQLLQARIIVQPILPITSNQIQRLANKTRTKIRILNQHNHNIYHPEFSG